MFDDNHVWAVVSTGGGTLIGRILSCDTTEEIIKSVNERKLLKMSPVFELHVNANVGPEGSTKMAVSLPFMYTMLGAPMYTIADGIQFFEDMTKADRDRYKKVVEVAQASIQNTRVKDAGLVTPHGAPAGGGPGRGPR